MHMPQSRTSGGFSPPHLEGITLNISPNSSCGKDREPSLLVKSQKGKHTKIMTNTLKLEVLLYLIKMCFFEKLLLNVVKTVLCFLRESDCSVH